MESLDTLDTSRPYDVLALGAHPDDVEMGMGGTVAALCASGRRVAVVSLTHGELGTHGDEQTRRQESRDAAQLLGCDVRHLNLPDGGVVDDLATRHLVARLIREIRPDTVFAPYAYARSGPRDGRSNVDHLAAGHLVSAGAKLARFRKLFPELEPHSVRRIWAYMVPDTVEPTYIADVSAWREPLVAAIEAYTSQMPIQRGGKGILDLLLLHRSALGARIGVELGESFLSEDPVGTSPDLLMEI